MRKLLAVLAAFLSFPALADELTTVDHYVKVISKVPAIEGQSTQIYVREVVAPESVLRGDPLEHRVVLFIHGAGTPAEVAFDPPAEGYSWMKHLARAGFDAFSMDMTGYGRSTRPTPMNDPCNLPERQRREMGLEECEPSYPNRLTTIESDWHDIDTVVDHLRELRAVDKVALIGWSLGGPRAGGYAARHEDKVSSLVLLAPAYFASRDARPEDVPGAGPVFNKQSRSDFDVGWERQVGCEGQYRTEVADAVWQGMMESDPVGATWEAGVRRRPFVTWWGFGRETVSKMTTPTLLFAGAHDTQMSIERVRAMYDVLGSEKKIFVDLACSSHNALWEENRLLMFDASVEWLRTGTVNSEESGALRLGY